VTVQPSPSPIRKSKRFGEQQRFMLLLITPAALLLLLFQVVPIFIGANASFRDWSLNNPKKTRVGLDQYEKVLTDPAFYEVVLPNTFVFMIFPQIVHHEDTLT
jgi:multiple sugar transport system permease protein